MAFFKDPDPHLLELSLYPISWLRRSRRCLLRSKRSICLFNSETPSEINAFEVYFLSSLFFSYRITWVPSAGSSTFHWQARSFFSLCCLNLAMILLAIVSKLCVARARMVGPAPDRHTPRKPSSVLGDMDSTISVRPGMRVWR